VWEPEIHRDVGRHQPRAEVIIGDVVLHGDAIADRSVGDRGADVGAGDAATHDHRMDVVGQPGDGVDQRRQALGLVDVARGDDDRARPTRLEGRAELARARLRAAHRRLVLDDGMRHDEDRRSHTDRLEVPLAEGRMDNDAPSGPGDGGGPHDPKGLVQRHVGVGHAATQRRRLSRRIETMGITRHLERSDEPVEREIVQHHEAGRGDGEPIDGPMEPGVVAELVDPEVVGPDRPLVMWLHRPQDIGSVPLQEPDTTQAVEDRPVV
jgi:hypothetical protein